MSEGNYLQQRRKNFFLTADCCKIIVELDISRNGRHGKNSQKQMGRVQGAKSLNRLNGSPGTMSPRRPGGWGEEKLNPIFFDHQAVADAGSLDSYRVAQRWQLSYCGTLRKGHRRESPDFRIGYSGDRVIVTCTRTSWFLAWI